MLRIITMKAKEHSKIGKKKRLEDIEWIPFKTSRGMPDDFHFERICILFLANLPDSSSILHNNIPNLCWLSAEVHPDVSTSFFLH